MVFSHELSRIAIGIKDDKTILGLDYDLKAMKWTDFDKYQRHLANDILANKVGGNLACLCNISFPKVDSKYICKVDITPSGTPVEINYRKDKNQQEKKYFFVRNSGSAKFLEGIDMARYCARRWTGGF